MNKTKILILAVLVLLGSAGIATAQSDHARRLHSPATIHGTIGGEAHNSYVVHARKGATITVSISWRHEEDNRAEFSVSKSRSFDNSSPLGFGKESNGGKKWTGKSPSTRDYYIFVVAHPLAHYTLKVVVK